MEGQGARKLRFLVTGIFVLILLAGLGTGAAAELQRNASLWKIADLYFDVALLITMAMRGPALLGR